jgi:glycosyltransferase involved in cell wall biosynthesis
MAQLKTIGAFHYQVGRTDGVSLELEKWVQVLEEMGHTVHLCAGDLGRAKGTLIEKMYHHLPEIERLYRNTFVKLEDYSPEEYATALGEWAADLKNEFRDFILRKGIDFIVAENVWSVAANPAVAMALEEIRVELDLPAVAHNHDFYWERKGRREWSHPRAKEILAHYLPPRDPKIKQVVINSLAQTELEKRTGLHAVVVPNVFDFHTPAWEVDEYNNDLRERIGLRERDLVLLQATRIVPRKGIELAIDLTRALDNPRRRSVLQDRGLFDGRSFSAADRIVLVLAGYARDDSTGTYKDKLARKAKEEGIEIRFIGDMIGATRDIQEGKKLYSLWDTYTAADMVTYPSLWEGWGNQFLEAIKARLPVVLFEYPVYKSDIKDKGFQVISLGDQLKGVDKNGLVQMDQTLLDRAADQAVEALMDPFRRNEMVNANWEIAQEHYSHPALRKILEPLFEGS